MVRRRFHSFIHTHFSFRVIILVLWIESSRCTSTKFKVYRCYRVCLSKYVCRLAFNRQFWWYGGNVNHCFHTSFNTNQLLSHYWKEGTWGILWIEKFSEHICIYFSQLARCWINESGGSVSGVNKEIWQFLFVFFPLYSCFIVKLFISML